MPDSGVVMVVTGIEHGLLRIVTIEEVGRQSQMRQWRRFPFADLNRWQQPGVGFVPLGDHDLLAGPGSRQSSEKWARASAILYVVGGMAGFELLEGSSRRPSFLRSRTKNVREGWSSAGENGAAGGAGRRSGPRARCEAGRPGGRHNTPGMHDDQQTWRAGLRNAGRVDAVPVSGPFPNGFAAPLR